MVVPVIWATFSITRGMTLNAYPYPFFDVSANGLASVLLFVAQILVFAVILAFGLLGFDKIMTRRL